MSTAAIVGGTVAGGLIGAVGSNMAAGTQAGAANNAANLQAEEAQNALNWQKQMFGIQEGLAMPWINTGTNALGELANLFGMPNPEGSNTNSVPSGPVQMNGGPGTLSVPEMLAQNGGPGGTMPMQAEANSMTRPILGTDTPVRGPFSVNGSSTNAPGAVLPNGQGAGNAMRPGQIFPTPAFPGGGTVSVNGQPPNITVPGSQAATQAAAAASGDPASETNPTLGVTQPGYFQPFMNWTQQFQAPTDITEQNDPGYQFRLNQGLKAVQNSAAAKGTLLTGGTAKDITDFAQNDASNEYANVYNRALGQYQQNYNIFQNNQTGQFNRLMALAGMGQTSAGQLTSAGTANASNVGNIDLAAGAQIGSNINNAGAARASGYVGGTNAITGGLNNLGQLAMLYNMYNQGGGTAGPGSFPTPDYNTISMGA